MRSTGWTAPYVSTLSNTPCFLEYTGISLIKANDVMEVL